MLDRLWININKLLTPVLNQQHILQLAVNNETISGIDLANSLNQNFANLVTSSHSPEAANAVTRSDASLFFPSTCETDVSIAQQATQITFNLD